MYTEVNGNVLKFVQKYNSTVFRILWAELLLNTAMSDDENSSNEEFIYYRERPGWKDIQPLPQDDGPHPVVQIAYTDRCNM